MSYICEFCSLRPENCACAIDLTEPRLETELAVADNIMAAENPKVQRPYGLLDAPSPADFFSLLVEMEREESKYDTPPSTPGRTSTINLPPPPKLVRQTNRPDEDLHDIQAELFHEEPLIPDAESSEFIIQPIEFCGACSNFGCDCIISQKKKEEYARESYEFARYYGTYDYHKFCQDFPENEDEFIKCPTCEEMIDPNNQLGMCYACFMKEQYLYPDDIAMELRYNSDRDSF